MLAGLDGARDDDLPVTARGRGVDRGNHGGDGLLQAWPTCRHQNHDGERAIAKILLVSETLVRGDEHLEPSVFRGGNEGTVLQARPAALEGGFDSVLRKGPAQGCRCALVEEDLHLCGGEGATGRMLENRTRLLESDSREPFDELVHGGIVLQILEKRRDRDARRTEHPCAADAARVAFDSDAGGPIDHARDGSTGAPGAARPARRNRTHPPWASP